MKFLNPVILGICTIATFSINAQVDGSEITPAKKVEQQSKQGGETPEARAERKTNHIFATLTDLTPEQKSQISDLHLKVENKIEAIRTNDQLTKEQKIEYTKGNRNDCKVVLKTILTEAQYTQLQTVKREQKAERKAANEIETDN